MKNWTPRNGRLAALSVAASVATSVAVLPTALHADELTIVMNSRLSVLDPILSASHQTRDHGFLIYDMLFGLDADQQIQPQMLEDYTVSDDGTIYTFNLREGLQWHDGTPVTAADAVASIRRWAERDRLGGALAALITDMTADDEDSFTVTLSEPTPLILDGFSKPSGVPLFIMPESVAATPASEAITDYTGSGPFIFVGEEFEPGARALYLKNENYVPRDEEPSWFAGGKIPGVDRIVRIEMGDPLTRVNALISGEIDFLQGVPIDLLPLIPEGGPVQLAALDELGYQLGYRLNHLQPPFNDRLARQAALYAIGQEDALRTQFGDPEHYTICGAAFGCGLPYESDMMADMVIESDIERARELLEESGYDGEPVLLFHVTDLTSMSSIPLVMGQQLSEAGFNVQLQSIDFMTMLSRRANRGPVAEGGWSIFVTSWHNTEIQDPIRNLMVAAGGEDDYAGWADVPELEAAVQEFLVAGSEDERVEIAAEIQRLTYEEGVFAPLGSFAGISAYGPAVRGVLPAPATLFWNITKEEN